MSCRLFSGVTFVLLCFAFVFLAFSEAAVLRSIVLRSSICMRPDSHAQLPLSSSFFVFVSLEMSLFPSIFVPLPFFSLYVENVVRFCLPDRVFLPCDHRLDF